MQEPATEQGRFDPDDRERRLGDLMAALDRAGAFYAVESGPAAP